jgi:hypothetical protein
MSLPADVLSGFSAGLLVGVLPAVAVGSLAFGLRLVHSRGLVDLRALVDAGVLDGSGDLSHVAAVPVALLLAAANGYAVDFVVFDPGALGVHHAVAAVLAGVLAVYANSQSRAVAAHLASDVTKAPERAVPLSEAAVNAVDAAGQVTVSTAGPVRELDGHPPLPPEQRTAIEEGRWRLPADLPLSELETRLADRLATEHDLEAVSVSIDRRGLATVTAAPAERTLARRLPEGHRAVAVDALVPEDLAVGDAVRLGTDGTDVRGSVIGIDDRSTAADATVTAAVPTGAAGDALAADRCLLAVEPGETSHEFEAFSLLEEAGTTVRRASVDGETADGAADRGVRVIAAAGSDGAADDWEFVPATGSLEGRREAFLAGDARAIVELVDGERPGHELTNGHGTGDRSTDRDGTDDRSTDRDGAGDQPTAGDGPTDGPVGGDREVDG